MRSDIEAFLVGPGEDGDIAWSDGTFLLSVFIEYQAFGIE